jgi:hypothetical protein
MLEAYAVFTAKKAGWIAPDSPDWHAARDRLYENAHLLGSRLRKVFRLRDHRDVIEMTRLLYKMLGIDFAGRPEGQFIIRSCFFSRFYSGQVCRLISSLDEGAAAGISGGGRLEFSGRITEGRDCCRGRFVFRGARR